MLDTQQTKAGETMQFSHLTKTRVQWLIENPDKYTTLEAKKYDSRDDKDIEVLAWGSKQVSNMYEWIPTMTNLGGTERSKYAIASAKKQQVWLKQISEAPHGDIVVTYEVLIQLSSQRDFERLVYK